MRNRPMQVYNLRVKNKYDEREVETEPIFGMRVLSTTASGTGEPVSIYLAAEVPSDFELLIYDERNHKIIAAPSEGLSGWLTPADLAIVDAALGKGEEDA